MCFSIFENGISGHSHLLKVENHEKLIENITMMRGSDCEFWIFQAFSDKYGKFQNPMFCSTIPRGGRFALKLYRPVRNHFSRVSH